MDRKYVYKVVITGYTGAGQKFRSIGVYNVDAPITADNFIKLGNDFLGDKSLGDTSNLVVSDLAFMYAVEDGEIVST